MIRVDILNCSRWCWKGGLTFVGAEDVLDEGGLLVVGQVGKELTCKYLLYEESSLRTALWKYGLLRRAL